MKIPFDIKYKPQIESGEYKVQTRDGSPARIICWDRHATEPYDGCILVALVTLRNKSESAYYYYSDGHLWDKSNGEGDSHLDLFIITDEPELTKFEQSVRDMIIKELTTEFNYQDSHVTATVSLDDKTAHRLSLGLLELAKKEICKGCTVGLEQYWKGREDARKEYEKSYTFHYPTYNPPCPHGGMCTNPFKDCVNCPGVQMPIPNIATTSGTCKKED